MYLDDSGSGMTFLDPVELVVTSVWPLAASEARYGDVPEETLITFNFYMFTCCLYTVRSKARSQ